MIKQIEVPLKPITINQCWKGRRFKTKSYSKWRTDFVRLISDKKPIKGKLSLTLEFYIKNDQTTDVDNLIKPCQDALKDARIIEDDRFITEVHAYKYKSKIEFIRITLSEI